MSFIRSLHSLPEIDISSILAGFQNHVNEKQKRYRDTWRYKNRPPEVFPPIKAALGFKQVEYFPSVDKLVNILIRVNREWANSSKYDGLYFELDFIRFGYVRFDSKYLNTNHIRNYLVFLSLWKNKDKESQGIILKSISRWIESLTPLQRWFVWVDFLLWSYNRQIEIPETRMRPEFQGKIERVKTEHLSSDEIERIYKRMYSNVWPFWPDNTERSTAIADAFNDKFLRPNDDHKKCSGLGYYHIHEQILLNCPEFLLSLTYPHGLPLGFSMWECLKVGPFAYGFAKPYGLTDTWLMAHWLDFQKFLYSKGLLPPSYLLADWGGYNDRWSIDSGINSSFGTYSGLDDDKYKALMHVYSCFENFGLMKHKSYKFIYLNIFNNLDLFVNDENYTYIFNCDLLYREPNELVKLINAFSSVRHLMCYLELKYNNYELIILIEKLNSIEVSILGLSAIDIKYYIYMLLKPLDERSIRINLFLDRTNVLFDKIGIFDIEYYVSLFMKYNDIAARIRDDRDFFKREKAKNNKST